jgi:hypothetical protein
MTTDSDRIFKTGWGVFLAVSLILSAAIDFTNPSIPLAAGERSYLFGEGSALVGWVVCVVLFVVPGWALRNFGIAPVAWWLAGIVCLIGYLAWMALNFDAFRSRQKLPSFTMIATLILGWRMLRTPRLTLAEEDHPLVEQEQPGPLAEFAEPPSHDDHDTSIQSSVCIPVAESAETRKTSFPARDKPRLIMIGLLVILAGIGVHALVNDESPSLSWMVLVCAIWSSGAWLWSDGASRFVKQWGPLAVKIAAAIAAVVGFVALFNSRMESASNQRFNKNLEMLYNLTPEEAEFFGNYLWRLSESDRQAMERQMARHGNEHLKSTIQDNLRRYQETQR